MRGREGGSVAGGVVNRERRLHLLLLVKRVGMKLVHVGGTRGGGTRRRVSFLAERAFAKKRKTDAGS